MQPTRLTDTMPPSIVRGGRRTRRPVTSTKARYPEMRKQAQPKASGRQTTWSYDEASLVVVSPRNVVTLKKRVPSSCTPDAHQSMRRGSHESARSRRDRDSEGTRSALTVSSHWSAAATVKNREPTKNVRATPRAPSQAK